MSTNCDIWPLAEGCLPTGWAADPEEWTPQQRVAVEVASSLLRRLTAGQYGLCRVKVRPCRRVPARQYAALGAVAGGPWMTPVLHDGRLLNIGCGCRTGSCGCGPICEVPLPGPVHDVAEVKVDGVVQDASSYRVDDHARLVRVSGACWPECQDLALPDTEVGTWSVTYRRGFDPADDAAAVLAVTRLAIEVSKACRADKTCALPSRVTQVVREGIAYDLLDDLSVFDRGRTGIPQVDLWLATVNPYGARAPMQVYSPDTVRARQQTWPTGLLPGPTPSTPDSYRHVQNVAAQVWTIVHNLGFYPGGVTVEDSTGTEIGGEVSYPDINTVRLEFSGPISGVAYLS